MPDLIRHPEQIEKNGFRPAPEWHQIGICTEPSAIKKARGIPQAFYFFHAFLIKLNESY